MKISKVLSGIADFLTAYCAGHCNLLGTAPVGTAVIGAGSACGRNVWMMFFGLLCSLLEQRSSFGIACVIYPVIWVVTAVFARQRQLQLLYPRTFFLSLFAGVETIVVHVAAYVTISDEIGIWSACAEGILVFSFMMVDSLFYQSRKEGPVSDGADMQTVVVTILFASTMLAGLPVDIDGQIEVLESVCLFSVIYVSYRFGFFAGVSWAAIAGTIYAIRLENMDMLMAWILFCAVANGLSEFLHAGRYGSVLIDAACYWLIGYFGFPDLISEHGIKSAAAALVLMLLLPGSFLIPVRMPGSSGGIPGNEWGTLTLSRVRRFSDALKRIDYTFAGTDGQRIGFSQIGTMFDTFTNQLDRPVALRKSAQAVILQELAKLGVQVKALTLLKAQNGKYQFYANARVGRGRLVGAETVRKIVSRETGIPFEIGEESRQMIGRNYDYVILNQKPAFRISTSARRLSWQEDVISGDNFYIGNLKNGQALLMIADGMGSGLQAAKDSEELLASVEELIGAGLEHKMAVQLVNAYLAEKNRGEHFTTLDMLLLDLYTGVAHLIKYGAAATYISRGNWMECVKSTSLPVGVTENARCECSIKKYFAGDLIVMVSDGVLDSIMVENKDDYMRARIQDIKDEEPEDIVRTLIEEIRSTCGNRLKDDATIIACRVMKNV